MSDRHFSAGEFHTVDGVEFYVEKGEKNPRDRVLMMLTPSGWKRIRMTMGFFLADFFYENEDVLYPPPQYQGGRYYLNACQEAAEKGWRRAGLRLDAEKQARRIRDSGEVAS